jgi:hypothetical protein
MLRLQMATGLIQCTPPNGRSVDVSGRITGTTAGRIAVLADKSEFLPVLRVVRPRGSFVFSGAPHGIDPFSAGRVACRRGEQRHRYIFPGLDCLHRCHGRLPIDTDNWPFHRTNRICSRKRSVWLTPVRLSFARGVYRSELSETDPAAGFDRADGHLRRDAESARKAPNTNSSSGWSVFRFIS